MTTDLHRQAERALLRSLYALPHVTDDTVDDTLAAVAIILGSAGIALANDAEQPLRRIIAYVAYHGASVLLLPRTIEPKTVLLRELETLARLPIDRSDYSNAALCVHLGRFLYAAVGHEEEQALQSLAGFIVSHLLEPVPPAIHVA